MEQATAVMTEQKAQTPLRPQARWCERGQAACLVAIDFDLRDPYARDPSVTK